MPAARSNWRGAPLKRTAAIRSRSISSASRPARPATGAPRCAAFTKAIELKPDFAYAHYYAALAYQRQRQLPKTAEHFDAFLRLAPDAPERSARDRDSEDDQVGCRREAACLSAC